MKKMVLVIALFAMVAFGAFASVGAVDGKFDATTDELVLSQTIKPINDFNLKLEAGIEGTSFAVKDLTVDLTAPGTVYFKIVDRSKYNLQHKVDITASVAQSAYGFLLEGTNGPDAVDGVEKVASTLDGKRNPAGNTVGTWDISYSKGKLVDNSSAGVVIGYFDVSWTGVSTLGAGTYVNTITLTYSAQ
jgi:hypothetical protein